MGRKEYNFSKKTKRNARKKKGLGGIPFTHVHHKIPVWVAKKYNIPPHLISREENAEAMLEEHHRLIHEYEKEDYYKDKIEDLLAEYKGEEEGWGGLIEDDPSWS